VARSGARMEARSPSDKCGRGSALARGGGPLGAGARSGLLRSHGIHAGATVPAPQRRSRGGGACARAGGSGVRGSCSLERRCGGSGRSFTGWLGARGRKRSGRTVAGARVGALLGRRGRDRLRRLRYDRIGRFGRAAFRGRRLRLGRSLGGGRLLIARGGSRRFARRLLGSSRGRRPGFGSPASAFGRLFSGRGLRSIAAFGRVFACTGRRLGAHDLVAGRRCLLAHR
jgi:hypothetical protein